MDLSGEKLTELAKTYVPERMINQMVKEEPFREFLRILIFMQMNTLKEPQESHFSHCLVASEGAKRVQLEIAVSIKGTEMTKQ